MVLDRVPAEGRVTDNPAHRRPGAVCQFCRATGTQRWTLCNETARGPYCGIDCLEADQVARALDGTDKCRSTAEVTEQVSRFNSPRLWEAWDA